MCKIKLHEALDKSQAKYVKLPCIVVPAYDGVRARVHYDGERRKAIITVNSKEHFLGSLTRELTAFLNRTPRLVLDGVLFYRGLEEEHIEKMLGIKSELIKYHIIDTIPTNLHFNALRRDDLYRRIYDELYIKSRHLFPNVLMGETYKASTTKQVEARAKFIFDNGYSCCYYRNIYQNYGDGKPEYEFNLIKENKSYG